MALFFGALVVTFVGCKKDTFDPLDSICPKVIATDPLAGSTGVPLSQVITVTFNEEMDPATITGESFIISGSIVAGKISYSGVTATFIPDVQLIPNHTYSGRVTTAVKDLMGNALQEDYVWTFSTGMLISPLVISTSPYDQETNVVLNKTISATFSELMDPLTIADSTFVLRQGSVIIPGFVSYSDSVAYFNPTTNLTSNTVYTATITTGVKNDQGVSLQSNYTWTFTTLMIIPPMVLSTDPDDLEIDVALNKTISATFNVPMDGATLNNATFTLKDGTNVISGSVSTVGNTAYFNPSSNLTSGTMYTATITSAVKDLNGTAMLSDYVWTFTTGVALAPTVISTSPANLETGVVLNKVITATFSEAMDPSTLNGATFIVKAGTTPITGIVTYTGVTASFTPTANLLPGTIYNASITSGAKNLAGTRLAVTYNWSFTTLVIPVKPTVISTDPANLSTNVAINKVVSATFSTDMDASSINNTTFTIKQGTTNIAGVITYSGKTAYFNPTADFAQGTMYTATLTTGIKNTSGAFLASDYVWTFTTGTLKAPTVISTDPANMATNVPMNKTITATFSENMNASTINNSTFLLKQGTTSISGTVSYSGTTASFKPTANLITGKTYEATITSAVKNTAGTNLVNNYVWTFSTVAPSGPQGPDLKSVANFGIIAGTAVSNNAGFSKINNMNVGIYPGARSSITGFPPAIVVNGAIYASDDVSPAGVAAMLLQAKNDLTAAYLYAEGASSPAPATVSGDQGGKTLAPGIYKSTSTLSVQSGDLTLDAKGDVNAVWIFQISSTFTTVGGAGGNIILSGGAQAKNVYWQVGSSATIGGYTKFKGNVLALTSITMGTYATAVGRMLARNGAVTLTSTNIIDKP